MNDFMLRTNTQEQMDDALIAAGLAQEVADQHGNIVVEPVSGVAIDHIGPIFERKDEDGTIVKPGDARWHTNVRVTFELDPAVEAALPTFTPLPAVPYRVFI